MPRFRKKPVEVDAMLLNENSQSEIVRWCHEGCPPEMNSIAKAVCNGLLIRTLEGEMRATFGDYIIKGVKGEFYPCKPDIFKATYEAV